MATLIQKTLGGLSREYYFRQIFFGCLMASPFVLIAIFGESSHGLFLVVFSAINTILYPYARFVYESIVEFFVGNNTFYFNAVTFVTTKFFTMLLCWSLSLIIAPIGLAYLYFYHSKDKPNEETQ